MYEDDLSREWQKGNYQKVIEHHEKSLPCGNEFIIHTFVETLKFALVLTAASHASNEV